MAGEKAPIVLKNGYRPSFPIRICFDFLIESVKNKSYRGWKVTMVVESFLVVSKIAGLSTILIGMILTKMFVDFDQSKIIFDVFGVENVCQYIDFPPSTYVMFPLFTFALMFGTIYNMLSICRLNIAYNGKKISSRAKRLMTAAHMYGILSTIWFATIYAVQPDRAEPVTMTIHVMPYINQKIAAVAVQCCIVWFGTNIAWKNIDFSTNKKKLFFALSWLHLYLMILEAGSICLISLNGIGDMGPSGLVGKGLWWNVHDPPLFQTIWNKWLDFAFFFMFPLIQSMIIVSKSYGHISNTQTVTFYIYDNISA